VELLLDDRHDVIMALAHGAVKTDDVSMHLEGGVASMLTADTNHFPALPKIYPT
jgi:hypothetical protein